MSLYFVAGQDVGETRLQSVAREFVRGEKKVILSPGAAGWIWVDDAPDRFGPAFDEKTRVRVLSSGRLAWSATDWARAARLPYSGGLANRLIAERYLAGGPAAVAPYNGAAVIIIHDPRSNQVHVWTDQFGYHPCFIYSPRDRQERIVTTFPDALLADPAASIAYDIVSMAEFIRAWRVTPPHTYFKDVNHAGAGTHVTIDLATGQLEGRVYWEPFQEEFFPNFSAAAEELASAVHAAVAERTAIAERPVFFISGGADSRVMLFAAADCSRVIGVNLYEHAMRETQVARELCGAAGCQFVAFRRDADFYPRLLPEIARWTGAMWSAEDCHYLGFAETLAQYQPDLVMTACTTDWLFKGYGLEKRYLEVFGRSLPILGYTDERAEGFLPNVPLPAPSRYRDEIHRRMSKWFAGCPDRLSTPRDRLMVEDRRVRPTAYAVSVSGQSMYRVFPYDTFLADSRVAACYSRAHPDWKLNRRLWGSAAAKLCTAGGPIVDANYGWRVDASTPEKLAIFGKEWIRRRVSAGQTVAAHDDSHPPSSGSWPDYGWYARNSKTIKHLWDSVTAEERDLMGEICEQNPWSRPLDDWSIDGQHLFRVLTLLTHWRESNSRRERANLSPISPSVQ